MKEKRGATLVSVNLPKDEKEKLRVMAQKEQRTVSNLAGVLLREAMARREKRAA